MALVTQFTMGHLEYKLGGVTPNTLKQYEMTLSNYTVLQHMDVTS